MADKPKIGLYWCASCGGCEESVVDLAEDILTVVEAVDIVFWPVAMDFKYSDVEAMEDGAMAALESVLVPEPSRRFCETTFCLIEEDKPHLAAAALALGRETVIPRMFERLLERMEIGADQAPAFHHYLKQHIFPEEDFHCRLSMCLLEAMCGDDPVKLEEAEAAAEEAICARIRFWDGVHEAIKAHNG